jgi:protease-4
MSEPHHPASGQSPSDDPNTLRTTAHADHPLDDDLKQSERQSRGQAPGWERGVLEKVLLATLKEQRAARRWRIFFRLATLGVFLLVFFTLFEFKTTTKAAAGRHTAMVSIEGEIAAGTAASAEAINASLQAAFEDAGSAGVILKINSPGGSPVQAGIINDEIRRLREVHPDKKLYVVVEEVCASGGYYIAAAADMIYVNKASIIGSIGVLMDGFGFTELMDKIGVERRLYTAGENKGMLDPFSPQSPTHRQYAQQMLDEIHQQFIAVVREGRGKRLANDPQLFSGLFWSGARSVELGLADGIGTADFVARDVIKAEDIVDYTVKDNIAERVAKRFGAAIGDGAVKALVWASAMQPLR